MCHGTVLPLKYMKSIVWLYLRDEDGIVERARQLNVYVA